MCVDELEQIQLCIVSDWGVLRAHRATRQCVCQLWSAPTVCNRVMIQYAVAGVNLMKWYHFAEYCAVLIAIYDTGRFIMFSVITNIYNKKTKGTTLMELFTATENLKFFWELEMFDVCTTGNTAHTVTIFKFLPNTRQHGCTDVLHCCNDPCLKAITLISYRCVPCHPWCTHRTSLVVKKTCSVFLWLWIFPLRWVLWLVFVITENIMKRPVVV
jgi:hypothetical protein